MGEGMHSESALGRFAPLGILAIGGAGALLLGTSRPELEARAQEGLLPAAADLREEAFGLVVGVVALERFGELLV